MKSTHPALILLLAIASMGAAKTRPPVLDPNACPTPYDPNVLSVASPMSWLPADPNVSVVSQVNVWNKSGRDTALRIEQLIPSANGWFSTAPIEHTILPGTPSPLPDPNGGYNKNWTWGFTPTEVRIYYILLTASTPGKPNWQTDRRLVLVYVEAEDVPILWVQDVDVALVHEAQRLWQAAVKEDRPLTRPTLIRLARY